MGLKYLVFCAFLFILLLSTAPTKCRPKDREMSRSSSRRGKRRSVKIDEPPFSPISVRKIREAENSISSLSPPKRSMKHRSPLKTSPIDRNRGGAGSWRGRSAATGAGASVRRFHSLFSRSKSTETDRTSISKGEYDIKTGEVERGGEGHLLSSNNSAPLHPHHTSREQKKAR